ncbi:SAM-dependent methyltransferase [Kangiella sediminilitoris]|uniref:Cyclopropane-fatty-acyl-phospholipid synthase n=1 Tax=Kangiella sediminilitoris TaxID=1144748 RepID=A0A1B3B842_9GAMM|nr:cyclopropane-fatty-acyl-phospholipid synthase family protein [Kangiella sediminilitoris]AOE48968.1 cyclopropane-fatty-acyl-phospholipid synthase [Kangiella sediminilitoris]
MPEASRAKKMTSVAGKTGKPELTGMLKTIRKQVKSHLNNIEDGFLTITDPLETYACGAQQADLSVNISIRDMDFYRAVALEGSNGAAQAYIDGKWTVDDLTSLVRILVRNIEVLDDMEGGLAWLKNSILKIWHYFNKNSKEGSKNNIAAHYDLGNDFFKLFLDSHMMYSSAIFSDNTASLEEASDLKLKTICEKLALKPEDHLIEIGTGWGGMAIYAAKNYGCSVTTTTISEEQFQYAKARVEEEGLTDKVTVIKQDYRDLKGHYDKLVSIEMIEAVGHQYLDTYTQQCSRLLKPDGIALIQAITIQDERYEQALKSVDFIKRYIFPGSFIPCVSAVVSSAAKNTDLRLINLEDFGESYAKTLNHWRERFLHSLDSVREQGFSEEFIRMWDFYLCYCEGGFIEKSISDTHMLFAKSKNMRQQWLALN